MKNRSRDFLRKITDSRKPAVCIPAGEAPLAPQSRLRHGWAVRSFLARTLERDLTDRSGARAAALQQSAELEPDCRPATGVTSA